MNITYTKEWFRSRAHLEEGQEIGAGLLQHVGKPALSIVSHDVPPSEIAFGLTVSLMRRKHRWTIDRLAAEAEATNEEILAIETDPYCVPELSTVVSLAHAFKLPAKALIHKAGLAELAADRLHEAPARYAACSEFKEPLSPDEEHVLEAVIKAIIEHPAAK